MQRLGNRLGNLGHLEFGWLDMTLPPPHHGLTLDGI
jgi:hypothetical protein